MHRHTHKAEQSKEKGGKGLIVFESLAKLHYDANAHGRRAYCHSRALTFIFFFLFPRT
jgi:hypothetical protein